MGFAYPPNMTATTGGLVPTPPNDSTKFLNGQGAFSAAGGGGLTVIGPTFATSDTTMTNPATWYTGATLGSALVNGKTYLISGSIMVNPASNDNCSFRLYDSTNGVEICSDTFYLATSRGSFSLSCLYSGFTGTPTIVIQALDNNTANSTIVHTAVAGAASKATFIQAIQIA